MARKITTRGIIAAFISGRTEYGLMSLYSHEIETIIPQYGKSKFREWRNASTYQRKFREMKQDGFPELSKLNIKITPDVSHPEYNGNVYKIEKITGDLQ